MTVTEITLKAALKKFKKNLFSCISNLTFKLLTFKNTCPIGKVVTKSMCLAHKPTGLERSHEKWNPPTFNDCYVRHIAKQSVTLWNVLN